MIEIRFHGRGGQGAVFASKMLAEACFREGNDVQSFPFFGVERRGAPVTAYSKIDRKPIRIKSGVYEPNHVVVLDPSLLGVVDVCQGLREGGTVLVNHPADPRSRAKLIGKVASVDATSIAIAHGLGSKTQPIVNSAILGAFCKVTGVFTMESLEAAVRDFAPAKREENVLAAKEAFNAVKFWS